MDILLLSFLCILSLTFIIWPVCRYQHKKNVITNDVTLKYFCFFDLNQRGSIKAGAFSIITVVFLSAIFYYFFGSFNKVKEWENINTQIGKMKTSIKKEGNLHLLINQLKDRVSQDSDNALGWYLLGRMYFLENSFADSVASFEKAYSLDDKNDQIKIQYAQALFFLDRVSHQALLFSLLEQVLHNDPMNMLASNLLAMNYYQQKDYKKAIKYWRRILANPNVALDEAQTIQTAMDKARQHL